MTLTAAQMLPKGVFNHSSVSTYVATHVSKCRHGTGRRYFNSIHSLSAIRAALEAAGIEFLVENGGGPGMRLWQGGEQA